MSGFPDPGPGLVWEENPAIRNNPFLRSVLDVGKQIICDPLAIKGRIEMEASIASAAKREISPATVQDEVALLNERLGDQLKETEEQLALARNKVEFLEATQASLLSAKTAIEAFLYPEQREVAR